jgi:hypothetical protein
MIKQTACLLTLYLLLSGPIWAQPSFTLNGSAVVVSENCYRLSSQKVDNDVASMWCEYPIQLDHALEIKFALNLGCSRSAGEGVAFVMHTHKDGYDAIGCGGSALGYSNEGDCENGLKPSLAIEFDTKYSRGLPDIYVPHLSLIQDADQKNPLIKSERIRSSGQDVRDCEYHEVRISWKPSTQVLEVYFDDEKRLSYKGNIQDFFGEEKDIYFGFTASTGRQPNMQMICIQSIIVEVDEDFERQKDFEEGVGIYPNPIREKLTIDIEFKEEQYLQMQLFDATGKLIYEIPTHSVRENQYYFNLPGLPSGVYYVTVTNGSDRVSRKIVHISTIRA